MRKRVKTGYYLRVEPVVLGFMFGQSRSDAKHNGGCCEQDEAVMIAEEGEE